MLNSLILVGRLTREIAIHETETGKKIGTLMLAIPRSFKNMDGIYETDFIACTIWEEKAKLASTYCHVGDIVGVKGRLQSRNIETSDGKRTILEVIGERITFLSSNTKDKKEVNSNEAPCTIEEEI